MQSTPHTPRQPVEPAAIMATPPATAPGTSARKSRSKSNDEVTPLRFTPVSIMEVEKIEQTAADFTQRDTQRRNSSRSPIMTPKVVFATPHHATQVRSMVLQAQVFDMNTEDWCYRLLFYLQELPTRVAFDSDAEAALIEFVGKLMTWPSEWKSRNPPQTTLRQILWDEICTRMSSTHSVSQNWLGLVDTVFFELLERGDYLLARYVCRSSAAFRAQVVESNSFDAKVVHSDRAQLYAKNIELCMSDIKSEHGLTSFGNLVIDYFGKLVALPSQTASPTFQSRTSPFLCGPLCSVCSCWQHLLDRASFLLTTMKQSHECELLVKRILLEVQGGCNLFCEVSTLDQLTIFARFAKNNIVELARFCCQHYRGQETRSNPEELPSFRMRGGEYEGWNAMEIACKARSTAVIQAMIDELPSHVLISCIGPVEGGGKHCCLDLVRDDKDLFDLISTARIQANVRGSSLPSRSSTPLDRRSASLNQSEVRASFTPRSRETPPSTRPRSFASLPPVISLSDLNLQQQ